MFPYVFMDSYTAQPLLTQNKYNNFIAITFLPLTICVVLLSFPKPFS